MLFKDPSVHSQSIHCGQERVPACCLGVPFLQQNRRKQQKLRSSQNRLPSALLLRPVLGAPPAPPTPGGHRTRSSPAQWHSQVIRRDPEPLPSAFSSRTLLATRTRSDSHGYGTKAAAKGLTQSRRAHFPLGKQSLLHGLREVTPSTAPLRSLPRRWTKPATARAANGASTSSPSHCSRRWASRRSRGSRLRRTLTLDRSDGSRQARAPATRGLPRSPRHFSAAPARYDHTNSRGQF